MSAIRTPDQRLRIFVSSTLHELAPERAAVREAVAGMRLTPVLFEAGARPYAPRSLYRAYLDQSDVFVGIYWERYGWIAPDDEISGLEDEYSLAGDRPKLIYVKSPAPAREPRLRTLLQRIRDADTASYRGFSDAEELRELIQNDLALLLTERFTATEQAPHRSSSILEHRVELPVPRQKLVDRAVESSLARRLLRDKHIGLVTLTGPGGSGKTRLALHVAASLRSAFEDGVYFISLAPLAHEKEVLSAIALSLGIPTSADSVRIEQIIECTCKKRLLLILDNFEHVAGAAPLVATLLQHCPQVKVLATSRSPLHVREEHELPVPPLEVPDLSERGAAINIALYPAIELFIARAREIDPRFSVTQENGPTIVEICARLDGLPLAIELAAARVKVLSLSGLLSRLERRLPALTGGASDLPDRQRTLRDTIRWSYDLLNEREKALFRRMSLFAGGFDVEAAEAMWPAEDGAIIRSGGSAPPRPGVWESQDVLDGVSSLVDKSLLWVQEPAGGDFRFGMLQTIREFGLDMLAASDDEVRAREFLTRWALGLAERALPELTGANQAEWLMRLDVEHPNMRAALEWSLADEQSTESALRLEIALWRHWWGRGYAAQGQDWLARALARPSRGRLDLRAQALVAAGELAEGRADYHQAEIWYDEALTLSRSINDQTVEASALNGLGIVLRAKGALERAEELHERALAILRSLGDERGVAAGLNNLGGIAYVRRDLNRAEIFWRETLEIVRRIGDRRSTGALLSNLGILAMAQGSSGRAIELHEEALAIARAMRDRQSAASAQANLASALFGHGDHDRALAAFTEALRGCRESGEVGSEAIILHDLGRLAEAEGDVERAAARYTESLRIFRQIESLPGIANVLERIGAIALCRADLQRAARFLAAAEGIRTETGAGCDDNSHEEHLAEVRAGLSAAALKGCWEAGSALTVDEAIDEGFAYLSQPLAV